MVQRCQRLAEYNLFIAQAREFVRCVGTKEQSKGDYHR